MILLDVGGTFVKSSLGIACKGAVEGTFASTPMSSDGTAEEIAASFRAAVAGQLERAAANGISIGTIGAVMPGPFDYKNGGVFLMKHKFAAVYGKTFREILGDVISPETRLVFAHDVNGALMGALTLNPELKKGNVAMSTLGTGLGFAYAKDGIVQESPMGSPAVDLWDAPYKGGILEEFVSRRAILRFYAEQGGILAEGEDVKEIADKARMGDQKALEAFRCAGRNYVAGAKDVLEKLEISHLLFAGQIAKSFDLMENEIREGLGEGIEVSVVDDIQGTVLVGIASL